jgi:hypothetical protein
MLSVRPLAGAFGDCCWIGGCDGWFGWLGEGGGSVFAAVVCAPLSAPLLEAALLACPALPVFELLGRLAPLLVFVPPAAFTVLVPFVPLVSLVPVVVLLVLFVFVLLLFVLLLVFVLLAFVLLGPFVFCGGCRGGKIGSDDETGDTLMIVVLAEIR